MLTARLAAALRALPAASAPLRSPQSEDRTALGDLGQPFRRAVRKAKLHGLWFHDLQRSFVTRARKAGIPDSLVMLTCPPSLGHS